MKKGERKWPAIREALGTGYWVPVDRKGNPIGTKKVEYMMKGNPRNPLGFQKSQINPGPGSKGRTGQMDTTLENRKLNEQFTDITSEEAAAKWKTENIDNWNKGKKFTSGPYKGEWEIVPENPTMEAIGPKSKYFRRYEHKIKIADPFWKTDHGLPYLSGDPENLTYTYPHQYNVKDAGEMKHGKDFIYDVDEFDGDIIRTPRKGVDLDAKFTKYDIGTQIAKEAPTYKVSKVAKAVKAVKPLAKFVPIVGAGVVGLDAKARTQEAIDNPTWQNKTQAALGGAELALEGFELATGGVGAIVTTPLQIGLMFADQMIHQTEDSFQRSKTDWDTRRAARRGQR